MRRLYFFSIILLLAGLLMGCGTTPERQSSPDAREGRTPTPIPASDEQAIKGLLQAESEGVVAQDINRLAELWAEDAVVRDAKHTPGNEDDDAVWRGIDAILDRYVVLVFPGNPQFAEPQIVSMEIEDGRATVVSTTHIGTEVAPQGDRWT
ncbi:MAG: nuclear transport factor 2 family protein, partial [Chloroflexi bacterium]|nr:nuclear transport factor 2 family protein [Chloroflexota bacterium]